MMDKQEEISFLPCPKIIAVDNKKEHLELIIKALLKVGLPALPLIYSIADGISPPEIFEPGRARILFLDLNLGEIENLSSTSQVASLLEEILVKLSPSGPFIIVFWTQHPKEVEPVISHIAKYAEQRKTPLPIEYFVIEKALFIDKQTPSAELLKAISTLLHKNKLFLSLLAWEYEIEKACAKTLQTITGLIKKPQTKGTCLDQKDLIDILRALGKGAFGQKNTQDNPGRAITKGLSPLLLDHIDGIPINRKYLDLWKESIQGGWKRGLPKTVSPAALNSKCIVDLNNHSLDMRGVWYQFNEQAIRKRAFWKKYFGLDRKGILEEFINPSAIDNEKAVRDSVKPGLLECTAACDFMNGKVPLKRFVLCAMVPSDKSEYFIWPNRKFRHDAIYEAKSILFDDGKEYYLFIDFKFSVSLPSNNELLSEEFTTRILRVRNGLLTDIIARFASHTTRPGYFSM
ncbi:hypothetical protein [Desulfotignum balticum]|jgi:hypothetical protein|uniref:hypothetical protein n=1 Tax=Desulfotignum balticum TaxID=115781 RepID=UPI0003FB0C71|nr:hypothetical protein [Desulfotignum balticum]